jgi:hypothetical protein
MSFLHAAGENECCLICGLEGGDERTRTADPLLAKQVLYQLSYVPVFACGITKPHLAHRSCS